jgi:branched-chain amino acid transport system permease protein
MIFRPQGIVPSRRRAREIAQAEAGIGGADALAAPGGAP